MNPIDDQLFIVKNTESKVNRFSLWITFRSGWKFLKFHYFCAMKYAVALLWVLLGFQSLGQVVMIENQRTNPKEGWSGSNDFHFNFTRNTKDVYQLSNRLRIQYAKDRHLFFIMSEIDFVKAGDSEFLNNGYEHMRYNFALDSVKQRFVIEVFRQSQFNRIQMIKLRSLYGAGIRVNAIQNDTAMLIFGVTPMAEFEYLTDYTENRDIRMSAYLATDWQFSPSIGFNAIMYYQPTFRWIQDYRMSIESGLRFRINSYLSYIVNYSLVYDEFPPEGIPRSNWTLRNGLRFRF